jgi:opacity protein-like surface antigen
MRMNTATRLGALAFSLALLVPSRGLAAHPDEPPAAEADDAPTRDGVGFALAPRFGLNVPTSKLGPFVVAGLELDLLLPVLDRRLVLALDATYTYGSYGGGGTDPRVGGAYTYDIGEKELKLGLDLVFRFFAEDAPIIPYIGAGLIMHFLQTVERPSFGPRVDLLEQSTEVGFELIAGVDFALGPGYLLADLRWVHTDLDHRLTGDTNAGNVTLAVGYRYVFF